MKDLLSDIIQSNVIGFSWNNPNGFAELAKLVFLPEDLHQRDF